MYGIFQGVIEDRIGFFPAAFAHLVHAGDRVFRCNRTFIGCKEQGQMTLKEGQVLSLAITDPHLCSGRQRKHRLTRILWPVVQRSEYVEIHLRLKNEQLSVEIISGNYNLSIVSLDLFFAGQANPAGRNPK